MAIHGGKCGEELSRQQKYTPQQGKRGHFGQYAKVGVVGGGRRD